MPYNSRIVGASTEPVTHAVDARWIMAYAAALGDFSPAYMDTQAGAVSAHPVFPVCLEWPAILNSRTMPGYDTLSAEEAARGVHAAHDLHIYRPIRPGDTLKTTVHAISLEAIRPGAAYGTRNDTIDVNTGELVCRTYQLGISRGVAIDGHAEPVELAPQTPIAPEGIEWSSEDIAVPEGAAHTYTECARIWNPIHTDRAVALAAGLPDIILHGTATLALAVSCLVHGTFGGDHLKVKRLGGRFRGMVLMPSTLTLRHAQHEETLYFEVLNDRGEPAIANGFVVSV